VRENLPVMKPKEVIAALEKAGFEQRRQTGSHIIMYKPGIRHLVSIPQHPKDLPKGTLRAIIREAGLTRGEFLKLL
jgi:predicted RNA binding protein YcfA (HicA-like mRNA interferase family)